MPFQEPFELTLGPTATRVNVTLYRTLPMRVGVAIPVEDPILNAIVRLFSRTIGLIPALLHVLN